MKMETFENYFLQLTYLLRYIEEEKKHVTQKNPFKQETRPLINNRYWLLLYFK